MTGTRLDEPFPEGPYLGLRESSHKYISKYNLVKVPEVEVWPEGLLRPGPQLSDLELANLVAGGLTRPGDVASNL